MELGVCEVSIPTGHSRGELETPFIVMGYRVWERTSKHVVLVNLKRMADQDFFAELSRTVAKSKKREALIFIPGYNMTFEDSCRRTAQIAFDLKFPGAPIMYSWASKGKTFAYIHDVATIEWSTPKLEEFITTVAEKSGAEVVHVIAHSMGNRALVHALDSLRKKRTELSRPLFNEIVLVAPDIDAGVFKNLADSVQKMSERTTLYVSSRDKPLQISSALHKYPRAGDAGENLTVINGIDTIDASEADISIFSIFSLEHTLFEKTSVLTDLFELLGLRRPPQERAHLRDRPWDGLTYWYFVP